MSLAGLLFTIVQIYTYLVFIYIILSWVLVANSKIGFLYTVQSFLARIVEPALYPIRRLLQPYMRDVPIDISPIVLGLILSVIQRLILKLVPI